MIDLLDKSNCPAIEEISEYVKNPVFMEFCSEIRNTYNCREKTEYSSCSWKKGWNLKFTPVYNFCNFLKPDKM